MYKRNPTSVLRIFQQIISVSISKSNFIHTMKLKFPFRSLFALEVLASNLFPSMFHQAQQIQARIIVNKIQNICILGTKILGIYVWSWRIDKTQAVRKTTLLHFSLHSFYFTILPLCSSLPSFIGLLYLLGKGLASCFYLSFLYLPCLLLSFFLPLPPQYLPLRWLCES